jgi:hypothetical protein
MNPAKGHKGAKEQIMFQTPTRLQETYQKEKRRKTWKSNKPKKALAYNNTFKNKGTMHYLQSYQQLLLMKNEQNGQRKAIKALC